MKKLLSTHDARNPITCADNTTSTPHLTRSAEIALDLLTHKRIRPVLVFPRRKRPIGDGWEKIVMTEPMIPAYFTKDDYNIGGLNGEPSDDLLDIDLDAVEAIALAQVFLPPTDAIFGRPSKRCSHRQYRAHPAPATRQFEDVGGAMLVELRSTGSQTLMPGSIHPSGESIEWEQDGEPATVNPDALRQAVFRVAAGALLARHYPDVGSRHRFTLALFGTLLRNGWEKTDAEQFVLAVAQIAGDEEAHDRTRNMATTERRLSGELPATGIPTLASIIGKAVTDKLIDWLGLKAVSEKPPIDEVQPFPLEVFPPLVRTLVEEGARSLVTPPDFIALPILVNVGAAIGDSFEIEAKPGWREGPNLYAGIVGDPGSKKTPAIDVATHGLRKLQSQASDTYERKMNTYLRELAEWEDGKKGDRGERPTPPVFQHFLTTDATTEALAPILKGSKGVLLIREELAGWVRSMDQYRSGRGADRQHYLSMWSRQGIKVDRKTAPPIIVEKPHLSVIGGIQPDLLPALGDAAQREDGFLDRLLFAYPDPRLDHWTEDGIEPETTTAVDMLFERLAELHKKAPMFGEPVALAVRFSSQALHIWRTWYEDHSSEVQSEAFSQRLRGPWAKMPGQLLRLCLILHVLWALCSSDEISDEVSAETVSMACDLIDYFKSQARRVYRQLRQTERSLHVRILEALKVHGEVNMRFLLHDVFTRNVPAAKIRTALEELEESSLITSRTDMETGGRPALLWRLA